MNDKKTLYTILVLLVIFAPMGIYGTIKHFNQEEIIIDDNPNKEFILNNKVYLYQNGSLIKTYSCVSDCTKVTTSIDDNTYNINYYTRGEEEAPTIIGTDYALFMENEKVNLFNFTTEKSLFTFDSIKTYNVKHSSPIIITKADGFSAVMDISNLKVIIPSKTFTFIGIPNRVTDGILDTTKFIVQKDSNWYVYDLNSENEDKLVNKLPFRVPIVDFNDNYVITANQVGNYTINDYDQNSYLENINKRKVYLINKYIVILTYNELNEESLVIYEDALSDAIYNLNLPTYEKLDLDYENNNIMVYLDDNLYQSIVLN